MIKANNAELVLSLLDKYLDKLEKLEETERVVIMDTINLMNKPYYVVNEGKIDVKV